MRTKKSISLMMGDGPVSADRVKARIEEKLPDADITLEYSEVINSGSINVDIIYKSKRVVVECRHYKVFYVRAQSIPPTFCKDIDSVVRLVTSLLGTK